MTISENEMAMFSCWKQQCERILPAIASVSCSVPATSCGSSAGRYSFFFVANTFHMVTTYTLFCGGGLKT